MVKCPYLNKICFEDGDPNVGLKCESDAHRDRGCYRGFIQIAFVLKGRACLDEAVNYVGVRFSDS